MARGKAGAANRAAHANLAEESGGAKNSLTVQIWRNKIARYGIVATAIWYRFHDRHEKRGQHRHTSPGLHSRFELKTSGSFKENQ